ncbi:MULTISPECIES: SdpI family protein [unclassified Nocardia]|uniref:SdpI family protein n=1 Tax=unclassified Nocardia TaxID=2637762 RepID=UPI001CE3D7EC|nr:MULTISPECIES: SdpI family protein [unclassified Nocardia]
MFVVALVLFVLAAVAIATGVLGLTGRLPRNRFVGVHTETALASDEAFRIANRVAAPTSVAAGVLLFAGGLVTFAATGPVAIVVPIAVAVIAIFTLGGGANAATNAIAHLAPVPATEGCGQACGACSLRDACSTAN